MTLDFNSLEKKRLKQIKCKQPCYYNKNLYTRKWYYETFKNKILDERMRDKYLINIKKLLS